MADARRTAVEALMRIEEGAYANLVLDGLLTRSGMGASDRRFTTELVYGSTRMRRSCDWLIDRFLMRAPDTRTRVVLRLGAYQLVFLGTPAHAAVGETVAVAPSRTRGLVNAVLRKVADAGPPTWPSLGVELSYPDWLVSRVTDELGATDAEAALRTMNEAPAVTTRTDGYVQDRASQWVTALVDAHSGERVLDLCAAPGGKATGMAMSGASVVANDVRPARAALIPSSPGLSVVVADGTAPALRRGSFDRILVDAPCSGLGVLRRRPDARWRISEEAVDTLARLQRGLLTAAVSLVRPGGVVVYSVCTMTAVETTDIDAWLAAVHPSMEALPAPGPPWRPAGRGALLLPQAAGTDGMFIVIMRRS
ncbi:MAG: transcription antitermination factor NusB [Acidimicrobiales bacterium]